MELGALPDRFFNGTFDHTLDSKGRVSLPAKFRKSLPTSLKLVPRDGTVQVFAAEDYKAWVMQFFKDGRPDPSSREDRMTLLSLTMNAEDAEIDSAGRISISAALCKSAGLVKEVKIVGAFDHIEIMSPETCAALNEQFAPVA